MSAPAAQPPAAEAKDNWSASQYSTQSFVYSSAYSSPVLSLLSAQQGERILDVGCGSGEVTLEIAKAVGEEGSVVGADMSRDLIRRAGELTKEGGVENAEWFVRDGHDLEGVDGPFDAAFSNAALHWMKKDPKQVRRTQGPDEVDWCEADEDGAIRGRASQVAQNVYDRLKPGGRYAAEVSERHYVAHYIHPIALANTRAPSTSAGAS